MEPNKFSNYTVRTRNGSVETLDISIVRRRMEDLAFGLNLQFVNLDLVVTKVQQGIYDGITTIELDNLAAETCAYMVHHKPHRISSILIIVFWRQDSPLIISGRRLRHPSKMLLISSITVKIKLAVMLLFSLQMCIKLSAKITKKLIRPFLLTEILLMISLVSKLSKGLIFSKVTYYFTQLMVKLFNDLNTCL